MSWLPSMLPRDNESWEDHEKMLPQGNRYAYVREMRNSVEKDQARDLMDKVVLCRTILRANPTVTMNDLRSMADKNHTCMDNNGEMLKPAKETLAKNPQSPRD